MSNSNTPTISVSGKAFVDANKNRFVVKGVALSASGTALAIDDILADEHHSLMVNTIIPALVNLNANCIRVYQVNPENSHKKTMASLEASGIYVMVGLATSTHSVKQMTGEYSYGTFLHASRIVDEFQGYDNTFCFSVGNEVEFPGQQASNLNSASPTSTAAQIVTATIDLEVNVAQAMKSFARDIKAYIKTKTYRTIPVGVAMQDGPQTSWENTNPNLYQVGIIGTDSIAQYYASGSEDERMDFIGINTYAYQSGATPLNAYDRLATECSMLAVPAFLTETGAIATPRTWAIVPQMYTDKNVYPQLSGQVAFQLLEEGAGYGLYDVSVASGTVTLTASTNGGAVALGTEFGKAVPAPLNPASAKPTGKTTAPASVGSNPAVPVSWLDLRTPYTYRVPEASITIENYAVDEVQIVQMDTVIGTVAAATKSTSSTSPTSVTMKVYSGISLSIQALNATTNAWDALCGVAASNVKAGITVQTNVTWGVYAGCNVGLASGDTVTVTVNNYAPVAVNVVLNKKVLATVPEASKGKFTTKNISLTNIGHLNLQSATDTDEVCSVPALLVTDNITIDNNLSWTSGCCNLPVPNSSTVPVTVENYSTTQAMNLIQDGGSILSLPVAASAGVPSSSVVSLSVISDLYVQYDTSGTWTNVCTVPAASIKGWMVIGNNVATYNDTCVISTVN